MSGLFNNSSICLSSVPDGLQLLTLILIRVAGGTGLTIKLLVLLLGLQQARNPRLSYRWAIVAVEHLATAVTESLMTLAYPVLFRSARVKGRAAIACVASEYHQIGGKIVADIVGRSLRARARWA